jgi:hypothetical protein
MRAEEANPQRRSVPGNAAALVGIGRKFAQHFSIVVANQRHLQVNSARMTSESSGFGRFYWPVPAGDL